MIRKWITEYSLNHLNQSEDCVGTYTFSSKKGKSAIDHILINDKLFTGFKGMNINEDKTLLDISDHCLVRAWFKIGHTQQIKCRKPTYKNINWIKKMKNHFLLSYTFYYSYIFCQFFFYYPYFIKKGSNRPIRVEKGP